MLRPRSVTTSAFRTSLARRPGTSQCIEERSRSRCSKSLLKHICWMNAKHMSSPDLTSARVLAFNLNERQLASPSCTVSIGFTLVSFSSERNATPPPSKCSGFYCVQPHASCSLKVRLSHRLSKLFCCSRFSQVPVSAFIDAKHLRPLTKVPPSEAMTYASVMPCSFRYNVVAVGVEPQRVRPVAVW